MKIQRRFSPLYLLPFLAACGGAGNIPVGVTVPLRGGLVGKPGQAFIPAEHGKNVENSR